MVVEPFWYDANGNLLFDNRNFYVYDAFNRLVCVYERGTVYVDTQADALAGTPGEEIAHYYYDALNRRVRTVNKPGSQDEVQVAHVFGGGAQVLAEYLVSIGGSQPPGGPDVLQRWFVHGQSFPDPLVMVDRTTTVGSSDPAVDDYYWYLKDALGSVGALADANGAIVERYTYDPYGQTHILLPDGTPLIEAIERSFYHDIDFDGMVGANEKASLDACVGSYEPRCLWLHDANDDGHVNQEDVDIFAESGWTSGDDVPVPPMWRRPVQPPFDVADRGSFDLLDYMQFTMCVGEIGVPTADEFCRILFDADGDADVDQYDYSLWDHRFTNPADQYEFPSQSRFGNPFMWTGQRYDADVGLYHFLYRSYSPEIGRWMQRDPVGVLSLGLAEPGGGLSSPPEPSSFAVAAADQYKEGLALYLYVMGRPTVMTDPLGQAFFTYIGQLYRSAIDATMRAGMYISSVLAAVRNYVQRLMQMLSTRVSTVSNAIQRTFDWSRGLTQNPMFRSALERFKGGSFTNAGRALTKHPGIVNANNAQELYQRYGNQSGINQAAAEVLKAIMRNGDVITRTTGRHGTVVEFWYNNAGVRFLEATNQFIGFLGK